MTHIAVIGAGITGVTTAYALIERGYKVTVLDRHRYAAMETSFANGGQISACNAEVWNNPATIWKGMRWLLREDAPLLLNLSPSWHKYSWLAEFVWNVRNYRQNTIRTVRLAMESRRRLFAIAAKESISFDLEQRGILHVFHDAESFKTGRRVNDLLREGGLERHAVSEAEIRSIEPALRGNYYGGFFTPSDATGDIHEFTKGLSKVCIDRGANFMFDANIDEIHPSSEGFDIGWNDALNEEKNSNRKSFLHADKIVVCAGVGSRDFAKKLGDRLNVYPVKGYSITVYLDEAKSQQAAPHVSLLDEEAKIVTSRLGLNRFRVAGTAEFNGFNRDIRADRIRPLKKWVRSNFPEVDTSRVVEWAGLRPMMPDMMPVVRRGKRKGVFYNTGHGHLGWTLSAATSELVADLISSG